MINQRKFPRDMSFVDMQGNVVNPSKEDILQEIAKKIGKAYAFFDYDASKKQIDENMKQIREDARTPKDLELLLYEGTSELQVDEKLAELMQNPDDYRIMSSELLKQEYEKERKSLSEMKYALIAEYWGASNEDAANELGDVINVMHLKFDSNQGLFRGAVVYEKEGKYHLKE